MALLAFFVASLGLLTYRQYRPPYQFYDELAIKEIDHSMQAIYWNGQKYVKFRQLQGAGFNNQAQEVLLYHHLALITGRTYVYQPFWWAPRKEFLPLSAFLLGPTQGTVASSLFDAVCPTDRVRYITIPGPREQYWNNARSLLSDEHPCIVVENWILNWKFLETSALHDMWTSYQNYLLHHFQWPTHILSITQRAYDQLNLQSARNPNGEPYLAIHFRRGDFEDHCYSLAESRSGFTTWATLPALERSIHAPPLDRSNKDSVVEHCYPDLTRILDVIDWHARAQPHMRTVHFLHDGAFDHPMVYRQFYMLETALLNAGRSVAAGWEGGMKAITHSGMLPVHVGDRDFKVAVDMEIARHAEVFVGNGYSSLSSQIMALRLADGGRVEDISIL